MKFYSSVLLLFLTGCAQLPLWVQNIDVFQDQETLEIPKALPGDYFPDIVDQTFSKVEGFQRTNRTLAEATKGLQVIEVKRLTEDMKGSNEANLNWSADGAYMGFEVSDRRKRSIFVRSLDGSYHHAVLKDLKPKKTLLDLDSYTAGIRWSKQSPQYVFLSNGGVGNFHLYLGGVGEEDRRISSGNSKDGHAVWSPNGDSLLFVSSRTGNGDLYLLDLESEELTRLTDSPQTEYYPEWSSDGNMIVYTSRESGSFRIKAMVKDSNGYWKASNIFNSLNEKAAYRPVISPDRKNLAYYSTNPDSSHSLKLISLHESSIPIVVSSNVVLDLTTGPSFSPDYRFLFYVENDMVQMNPIMSFSLMDKRNIVVETQTQMNRDVMISNLGILSFRAQVGAWDRVFIALTNTGKQFHSPKKG